MADLKEMLKAAGKATGKAGAFVGKKAVEYYKAVDPDVIRHVAQLPLLSYCLFVGREEEIDPGISDGKPPIIFVHGLGGNRGNFLLMAWYMGMMGRSRSYKISFGPGQTLDEMAAALASFIRKVKKRTEEPQVEIVAHSLGGLTARMAVCEHRAASSVKTLITLGSPHKGTYSARYGNTSVIKDLRPDSELIKRLNSKPFPKKTRLVAFFSKNDVFILPPENACLEDAENVEVTPFTHYSYLIDPKCWAAVYKILEEKK